MLPALAMPAELPRLSHMSGLSPLYAMLSVPSPMYARPPVSSSIPVALRMAAELRIPAGHTPSITSSSSTAALSTTLYQRHRSSKLTIHGTSFVSSVPVGLRALDRTS
ncbi:hypothetical protein PF010_g872 [Phytophthora fragariae]|uniref:Uncharacterized protein n=1 Tax=Phytophthora fragariae TaxID=53985 RepID=A0A6G0M2A6_9STRA|nr:hypothetical protein PF010_g872 [Phytophthora fragariae]